MEIIHDDMKENKGGSVLVVVFAILFVLSSGLAYFFYTKVGSVKTNEQAQQDAQAEVKDIVLKVSKLILLPQGEDPTLATVVDPERLRDQPFFARTSKGDKVLIYTKAKKAILYNPTVDKIVEVAPISLGNPTATSGDSSTAP
jgi:hypothetical protein